MAEDQGRYLTPLGDWLTYDEARAEGRVICPVCEGAVIEDEYTACWECEEGLCIYCWEDGACPCKSTQVEHST